MMTASCCRAAAVVAVIVFLIGVCLAATRPQQMNRLRRSGISDQRLAELETLIALARLKGRTRAITNPIAFGVIDPDKIGRRRKRRSLSYDELVSILEDLQEQLTILEQDNDSAAYPPPTSPLSASDGRAAGGREEGPLAEQSAASGRTRTLADFLRPRRPLGFQDLPSWPRATA